MNVQDEQQSRSNRKVIIPLALSLFFLLLSALFFIPVPHALTTSLGAAVLNTGHIIFFCMFALAFYPFMHGKNRTQIPRFVLLVFLLSLVIETIQSSVGRAFQWEDILRNVLGTVLGISIQLHFQRQHKPHWGLRLGLLVAIVTAIVVERIPLIEKLLPFL